MPPTAAALEAAPDPTGTALILAKLLAQRCFHDMVVAGVFPDPDHPLTKAYVASERVVDELMVEAQGRAAQDGLDALIAADAGNHFAGMPR